MANQDHKAFDQGFQEKHEKVEHLEIPNHGRGNLRADSATRASFDRRHSASTPGSRRDSIRKSFDKANLAMVFPDSTHLEVSDDGEGDIDQLKGSWFVWLTAATASIAGFLFGYDTGIISAVLVYLGGDLNHRPATSSEKELITSLTSGGAFFGAIIAGLTADKVTSSPSSCGRHLLTCGP
jgi:SP family myo-inositol transporter-like MFS transporter 13